MIAKGAKGTPEELNQVVNYLAASFPANAVPTTTSAPVRPRGGGLTMGPNDKQIVSATAANRGRAVYVAECVTCHGAKARGANDNAPENQRGPDLVRSVTVLHDRYGSTLTPFLKGGHKMQSGRSSAALSQAQIIDLSHFLHEKVDDTLRSGPYSKVINVLTGDAKAGEAYFNGAGNCKACHSPSGDFSGIAAKYDLPTLQQKLVFPRTVSFGRGVVSSAKPVMITVTVPSGESLSGTLVHLDDFNVSMRDHSGAYHSWKRTAGLKIEKRDPYSAHVDLLDKYTDKNIHDLVAYLETLK
jgi:mono/diheme cytochrome c family protein